MAKKRRFTRQVLERFEREGRGTGTHKSYIPWHRVTRSDPSSCGRSHLITWGGRQIELLSDLEWVACCFSMMAPNVIDIREQFPLSVETSCHELCDYDVAARALPLVPGTYQLAQELGVKHPMVPDEGTHFAWTMTTDLLLTLQTPEGARQLLAISCKYDSELDRRRTREKLRIEASYWARRNVRWLLISPSLYQELVALTLRRSFAWYSAAATTADQKSMAIEDARRSEGRSLTDTLVGIASHLGDMSLAQRAFWQSVWCGEIPLDLRRGWRPHLPISLLSSVAFLGLNPIASGRTSWIG